MNIEVLKFPYRTSNGETRYGICDQEKTIYSESLLECQNPTKLAENGNDFCDIELDFMT